MMEKVAIVTGATSGIGLSAAAALKGKGWRVFSVSRRARGAEGFEHISCDVSDESAAREAVELVMARAGRLDALVNAAGFGISGALEFTTAESARAQLDVNVIGTANMCRAALPHIRDSKGAIVNISSVAAALPIPFQGWYSASKAAINAYTLALANEARRFGVRVCAVMPGDIATGFTAARQKNENGAQIYGKRIEKAVSAMEKDERNGMDPAIIGKFIAKIVQKQRVKPLYSVGFFYRAAVIIQKILPCAVTNYIVGKLY